MGELWGTHCILEKNNCFARGLHCNIPSYWNIILNSKWAIVTVSHALFWIQYVVSVHWIMSCHDANFVITDSTVGCHKGNSPCFIILFCFSIWCWFGHNDTSCLTNLGLNKIATILRTTFQMHFLKKNPFWFKFHWNLFLSFQLAMSSSYSVQIMTAKLCIVNLFRPTVA